MANAGEAHAAHARWNGHRWRGLRRHGHAIVAVVAVVVGEAIAAHSRDDGVRDLPHHHLSRSQSQPHDSEARLKSALGQPMQCSARMPAVWRSSGCIVATRSAGIFQPAALARL